MEVSLVRGSCVASRGLTEPCVAASDGSSSQRERCLWFAESFLCRLGLGSTHVALQPARASQIVVDLRTMNSPPAQ
jgi:hypothetical protein